MKNLIALTAGLSMAASAYAQSSVTLYGTVDDGLTFTNNQAGSHNYQASNGALGSSKWGFATEEALGGGLYAVAKLENGFDINTGKFNNGGRLFGRQAYVGLTSPFGTVRIGRQYDLVLDTLLPASPAQKFAGILGVHAADVDNVWGDYSESNAVKYISPIFAGLKASALFSFGGVAGDFSQGKKVAASLTYTFSSLDLAAVFSRIDTPSTSIYDAAANPVGGAPFANPISNPTFSGYVSARSLQVAGASANYRFGSASVAVEYTNTRFQDVVPTSTTPFQGTASFNSIEANATYNMTQSLLVGAGYTYTKAENAKYGQLNVGTEYSISKRTLLYAVTAWEHASGIGSTGKPAVAALNFLTPSSTQNQVAVRLGIRHNF